MIGERAARGAHGALCRLCAAPIVVGGDAGLDAGQPVHISCYVKHLQARITGRRAL